MAKRTLTPTCCLTLPLKVEPWQADVINKRMEICRSIYNALIGYQKKQYKQLTQSEKYRKIKEEIKEKIDSLPPRKKGEKKSKKENEIYKNLNKLYNDKGFTMFGFTGIVTKFYKHFNSVIDSDTARGTVALPAWQAFKTLLFGGGNDVHFKKKNSVNTLCGTQNDSGIIYRDGYIIWNKEGEAYLKMKVRFDKNNQYEKDMMSKRVKYCRIIRKWVKTKYHYYAQLVLEGTPAVKQDTETRQRKHPVGTGNVGLYITTDNISFCTDTATGTRKLADGIDNIEEEKAKIQQYLDRSKRLSNPDNFDADGIKTNGKLNWIYSNNYRKAQGKLKELERKQADVRKLKHNILANELLTLGDNFYVNEVSFKNLMKRANFPEGKEKTKSGRNKSKKRFGKTIANHAPSMMIEILERKLKQNKKNGITKIKINNDPKFQCVHTEKEPIKTTKQRKTIKIGGNKVSRSTYNAFLVLNANVSHEGYDKELCEKNFENFLKLKTS